MGYAELIAAALQIVGSIVGGIKGDADRAKAQKLLEAQFGDIQGLDLPKFTDDVITAAKSGMGDIQEDPRLRSLQMQALDGLSDEVAYRGMTPEDAAAYNRARQMAGSVDNGLRGAAEHQAAARGTLGSTAGYVGSLMGAQAATNRASDMGLQAAADSRDRYIKALNSLGAASGNVRGQDWNVASDRARAQDAINQFNASQRFRGLQQGFNNQVTQTQMMGDVRGQIAGMYNQQGDRDEKRGAAYGAYGGDVAKGLGSWED